MPVNVEYVTVSFGASYPEEVAYRDGAFVAPYLASTRTLDTFALRRTGGWPRNATVRVQEGAPKAAAFTTVDPTAWGQWTLSKQAGAGTNRVPGRTDVPLYWAPDNDQGWCPDLVPGHSAFRPWVDQQYGGAAYGGGAGPTTPGAGKAPNFGEGPHTLAGRFFVSAFPQGTYQVMLGTLGAYPNARNSFAIGPQGNVFMQRYGTGVMWGPSLSALKWPNDGLWHYASARYDATSIRFGIDGTFATIAASTHAGYFPGACMISVCRQVGGYQYNGGGGSVGLYPAYQSNWNAQQFWGGAADVGVWSRWLTDAEIVANASTSLGRSV